jgi:hypothetical protein
MATQYLQGFEQVIPTSSAIGQVLPNEVSDFYGFQTPETTTDWFLNASGTQDETSGPMVTDEDARVTGQCLRIRRPNAGANQSAFNGAHSITFTRSMADQTKVVLGVAIKYDKVPEVTVPILSFSYDDGVSTEEQLSVWASPQGALMVSAVDFDVQSITTQTPTPITDGITPNGIFNFQQWMYIEVSLDVSGLTPQLLVALNNRIVLDIYDEEAAKASDAFINRVSIINPHNLYFIDDAYTMYVDDIYVLDGNGDVNNAILGPQYVMFLPAGSSVEASWTVNGGATSNMMAVGKALDPADLSVFAQAGLDALNDYYKISELPLKSGQVTILAIGAFVSIDAGSDPIDLLLKAGDDEDTLEVAVNTATPFYQASYHDKAPNGNVWSRKGIREVRVGIAS